MEAAAPPELIDLLRRQDGVVARRQVMCAGYADHDIARLVRGRHWSRHGRGVLVDHTGPVTWVQRAWIALLSHPVAALDGASALRAHGLRTGVRADSAPIEIVVPAECRAVSSPGVRSRRMSGMEERCLLHLAPPRVRLEEAVLRVASGASREDEVVAVLGDAVQTGRTTPARLRDAVHRAQRLTGRAFMLEVLEDVAEGALSAMERRYLVDVERAHGLPQGRRQVRATQNGQVTCCDVRYHEYDADVELDGRVGHTLAADRWKDLDRDLGAAVSGRVTLRAGWRQVLDPCRLARVVAEVLRARGWTGARRPCPRCPSPSEPAV